MKNFIYFLKSLRIKQWIKNGFIFATKVFSLQIFEVEYMNNGFLAFILFVFVMGSIYVINDCFDKKYDKRHPEKRKRPIASEKLSVPSAVSGAVITLLIFLYLIYRFNFNFFIISVIYILINLLYSIYLKKIVIFDVMIIAIGFVLRIEVGGVINHIKLSPWILIMTFLGALFVGFIKRRQELVLVNKKNNSFETRKTLEKYNLSLLDQLISITTATTLISYIIYVLNPEIQQKHTKLLYVTIPFVIFGIFRYLYLTYVKGKGEDPTEVIISDLPFALNIVLWAFVFVLLIVFT